MPKAAIVVKAARRRIHQHDLDMYAAIAGQAPAMPPPRPAPPPPSALAAPAAQTWSPLVLCTYLRQAWQHRLAGYARRQPEVADWVRKLSDQAIERLQQAQARLAAAKARRAREAGKPVDSVN